MSNLYPKFKLDLQNDLMRTPIRLNNVLMEVLMLSIVKWTEAPINILGVIICHRTKEVIKLNYTKTLKKMENILKIWCRRYLTLYGKVTIINTFVIFQLVYLLSVLPSPSEEMLMRINKLVFEFVWNAKPDKVKRSSMKLPKKNGGVSVPDIVLKDQALKIV